MMNSQSLTSKSTCLRLAHHLLSTCWLLALLFISCLLVAHILLITCSFLADYLLICSSLAHHLLVSHSGAKVTKTISNYFSIVFILSNMLSRNFHTPPQWIKCCGKILRFWGWMLNSKKKEIIRCNSLKTN